jgi:hypothetical protein
MYLQPLAFNSVLPINNENEISMLPPQAENIVFSGGLGIMENCKASDTRGRRQITDALITNAVSDSEENQKNDRGAYDTTGVPKPPPPPPKPR